jgi:rhodanese-related sulfurtransferase
VTRVAFHRALAGLALGAGLLAAVAGDPAAVRQPPSSAGGLAPAAASALAERIEREEDHVTAPELADWLRARRPGLRIVDLRPPEEFATGHLPAAENRSLRELVTTDFAPQESVVLVSAGGGHAAQAWVLLAARGAGDVRTLAGGYDAWLREVLYPELPRDADAAAQAAFAKVSERSRYFGGRPRIVDTPEVERRDRAMARTRRGGC